MLERSFEKKVKAIRSDQGGEYMCNNFRNYMKQKGIKAEYAAVHTPEQNGLAERKNRSLIEMTRCMLADANLNKKYWGEAVLTANCLQNRLPSRSIAKTPYELWYSQKPDVKHLQIFGTIAYAHIPKIQRRKLDDKGKKLVFVGYSGVSKAYRLLDMQTDKIIETRDVIFSNETNNIEEKGVIPQEEGIVFLDNENANEDNDDRLSQHSSSDSSTTEVFHSSDTSSMQDFSTCEEDSIEESESEQEQKTVRRSNRPNKGVPPDR